MFICVAYSSSEICVHMCSKKGKNLVIWYVETAKAEEQKCEVFYHLSLVCGVCAGQNSS